MEPFRHVVVSKVQMNNHGGSVVDRYVSVNRAVLVAFCGLLASTPVCADPLQEDQFQTDLLRDDQPQPNHKRRVVHRVDPAVQLRHTMRDEINSGLVAIVSEGTDYTVDLALALASAASAAARAACV